MNKNIKVIILTLEKYPARLIKLKNFIKDIESLGFNIEIYYGVDGSKIDIEEPDSKGIRKIKYND